MKKNIYNFVSNDDLRPAYMGVFHDGENKVAVASDFRILLLSKPDYNEQLVNAARHSYDKDGHEITTQSFQHYIGCLSEGRRLYKDHGKDVVGHLNAKAIKKATEVLKELKEQVQEAQAELGQKRRPNSYIYVRVGKGWFNAKYLSKLLPYFGDGAEVITPNNYRAAYLKNDDYEAIIMPAQLSDRLQLDENVVAVVGAWTDAIDLRRYVTENEL